LKNLEKKLNNAHDYRNCNQITDVRIGLSISFEATGSYSPNSSDCCVLQWDEFCQICEIGANWGGIIVDNFFRWMTKISAGNSSAFKK